MRNRNGMISNLFVCGTVILLSGCYSINKLNVQNAYNALDIKKESRSGHKQDSVVIELITNENSACVMITTTDAEEQAKMAKNVCRFKPIAGVNPKEEWKQLYAQETAKKFKSGFIGYNTGTVLQDSLQKALEQYFEKVQVRLTDKPSGNADAIVVQQDLTFALAFGKKRTLSSLNAENMQTSEGFSETKMNMAHLAWYIPFFLATFPAFVWAPMMIVQNIHNRASERSIAEAINLNAVKIAEQIAETLKNSKEKNLIDKAEIESPPPPVTMEPTAEPVAPPPPPVTAKPTAEPVAPPPPVTAKPTAEPVAPPPPPPVTAKPTAEPAPQPPATITTPKAETNTQKTASTANGCKTDLDCDDDLICKQGICAKP